MVGEKKHAAAAGMSTKENLCLHHPTDYKRPKFTFPMLSELSQCNNSSLCESQCDANIDSALINISVNVHFVLRDIAFFVNLHFSCFQPNSARSENMYVNF